MLRHGHVSNSPRRLPPRPTPSRDVGAFSFDPPSARASALPQGTALKPEAPLPLSPRVISTRQRAIDEDLGAADETLLRLYKQSHTSGGARLAFELTRAGASGSNASSCPLRLHNEATKRAAAGMGSAGNDPKAGTRLPPLLVAAREAEGLSTPREGFAGKAATSARCITNNADAANSLPDALRVVGEVFDALEGSREREIEIHFGEDDQARLAANGALRVVEEGMRRYMELETVETVHSGGGAVVVRFTLVRLPGTLSVVKAKVSTFVERVGGR